MNVATQSAPDDLVEPASRQRLHVGVVANDAPLRIDHQNDDLSGVDQPFGEIALRAHRRLGRHALGDVAQNGRVEHLVADARFRHRQLERKRLAAPASPLHGANATDGVALAGALVPTQILGVLLAVGSRHEHRHVPAHDLRGRVAEHLLGGPVEERDRTGGVDRDHRVTTGGQHRLPARVGDAQGVERLGRIGRVGLDRHIRRAAERRPSLRV